MNQIALSNFMSFNRDGVRISPLFALEINHSFIIGVYQGSLSQYDILIKYRQKLANGQWSRIRTPKHIHWAVDILIKMHSEPEKTQSFLDFLMQIWEYATPFATEEERNDFLKTENLLEINQQEIFQYESLSSKGEYSIKFLVLLAKLLMAQEKTNMRDAYMFKNLLEALRANEDIFKIVSTATHR